MSKLARCVGVPALVIVALGGCGKSSKTTSTAPSTPLATPAVNSSIAAQVPAKYKTKGTLMVASEAQYAPNEFIAADGHTVIGMDPDMVRAIAAVMGLKVQVVNSTFEAIIPGLAAGRYDIGASSFTDTKEREKTVDFVTYLSVGQAFLAKANGGPAINTPAELCGHTVSVEKGTVELEEAEKQNKKCAAGKPIKLLIFPGQNDVADHRLPGQEAGRLSPQQSDVRSRPVRFGAGEGQRPGQTGARSAEGADSQRHVRVDPQEVGTRQSRDQQPGDQRRQELSAT